LNRTIQINTIASNVINRPKSKHQSTHNNQSMNSETKKQIAKIKKLLKERDFNSIDIALSILEGLNDETLLNELLEGIEYKDRKLVPNKIFKGTGPAQPYLNYAMLGLLKIAENISKWQTLVQSITDLKIEMIDTKNLDVLKYLQNLEIISLQHFSSELNLAELKKLVLTIPWGQAINIDLFNVKNCKNLTYIDAYDYNANRGLAGLSELTNLNYLSIRGLKDPTFSDLRELKKLSKLEYLKISEASKIESLNGLENCTELKYLYFHRIDLIETKALTHLKKIENITINNSKIKHLDLPQEALYLSKIDLGSNMELNSISDTIFPEELTEICINNTAFTSFPTLRGVKTMKSFRSNDCEHLLDLKGLSEINKTDVITRYFYINGTPNLQNFNDILHLNLEKLEIDIKKLSLDIPSNSIKGLKFKRLEDLTGIEQFESLECLILGKSPIKSLQELKNLKNLQKLYLNANTTLESLDGIENISSLKFLSIVEMTSLKDIKALDNMQLDELFIADGAFKKADFPAHLQDKINWQEHPRFPI